MGDNLLEITIYYAQLLQGKNINPKIVKYSAFSAIH